MKTFFKVIKQFEPATIQKQDGSTTNKSYIMLQEVGSKYEDTYTATLLGNSALCKFYPNDFVYASLRFTSREYNDNPYMDCTVQDIISFTQH